MYPDEIMRMDNQECLILLRGQKPLRLYKIIPDEHPSFGQLRDVKVSDSAPPPKPSSGWGPKYDYGLLDPVDGFDGAEQEPDSGQDTPYGGFDLIEAEPQDVGGEHQEGQR